MQIPSLAREKGFARDVSGYEEKGTKMILVLIYVYISIALQPVSRYKNCWVLKRNRRLQYFISQIYEHSVIMVE